MQTFLPWGNFRLSASTLHMKHLGKQRVENLQILGVLQKVRIKNPKAPSYEWIFESYEPSLSRVNNPCIKMWKGYECALLRYQAAITDEWVGRGYKDTCWLKTLGMHADTTCSQEVPWWLGNPDFHLAHQSMLIGKKPEHYLPYFPAGLIGLPYLWPNENEEFYLI